jgi:hypothetical protein
MSETNPYKSPVHPNDSSDEAKRKSNPWLGWAVVIAIIAAILFIIVEMLLIPAEPISGRRP